MFAISTGFAFYLAKGHLDWLPDWVPLALMGGGGLYWVIVNPRVRLVPSTWFRTEAGLIIHPETKKPAIAPRLRTRETITALCVFVGMLLGGGLAWWFRAQAIAVIAQPEFVFSGADPDPFGGQEIYSTAMVMSIDNKARYPTGLTDWKASLKFPDGKIVNGWIPFATDIPVPLGTFKGQQLNQLTLRPEDYLPVKGAQAISPGGGTWGYLPARFKGYTRKDVRGKGATLVVEFNEIATGKHHVVTDFLDGPSSELPPGTFPIRKGPAGAS